MNARPVWAEVSRSRLAENFRLLRALAAPAELLCIVKADGYGHGAVECGRVLSHAGAGWLGVTDVDEGVRVRAACPSAKILVMGGVWPGEAQIVFEHNLTPAVWEPEHLAEAARAAGPLAVHLEIDTGMSRQGVQPAQLPALLDRLQLLPALRLDGVMTHFHSPEMAGNRASEEQFTRFASVVEAIRARGLRPHWLHAGNSTSLLHPGTGALAGLAAKHGAQALLRPGLALYGYAPRFDDGSAPAHSADLKPVLTWKTRILSLRWINPGETAGYCATFRAARQTRLALLPVGYADGLNRLLSNRGVALVRGCRAPIAGRVSMDLTILDVTDVPGVETGDEVVLIGEQGAETITAYDHADAAGTIPYEILCNIHARVPRIMTE